MAFGGGFGGFGQQQSQPAFGAPASSPFGGGGGGAFGQAPPAFGAAPSAGFGASQPAFGASTPAFGAAPSFGGSSAFGARPAGSGFGFGSPAPAASPFGASAPAFGASTPSFGASSTPAFGGGFGAPASTPAFGVASTPAFGATSTPAFGAASSPFGASAPAFGAPASTPAFGGFGAASTPAFGAAASSPAFGSGGAFGGGGFGAASPGAVAQGTRVAPYVKHQDKDQSGGTTTGGPVYYNTITAMPAYQGKSVEELRWEDYQAGVKNASAAPAPAAGGFGAPAASAPFGGFGASPAPAFGAASTPAANPFGTPAASSPFGGGFGASSTPAFGAPSSSPFGSSTPAFGAPASTPAFGGFGAASTPSFGGATAGSSLFGAASSASGGFGFGSSTPAFGAPASTPAFGAPAATPGFGGFGASPSSSPFGASPASSASPFGTPSPSPFGSSTPAFGAAPSSSPFGGFGASAPSSSGSTFGGFGSSFGAKPASTPAFSFGPASSTPAFGAPSAPATGAFSFNAASTGGFGSSFGAPGSTPAFSFSQPASQPASGGFNFGGFGSSFGAPTQSTPGAAPAAAPAAAPPGVAQSPYGALSPLPAVSVPEPKVGISARPVRSGITTLRPSPLLTLRATTPRFGAGPAPRSAASPAASPPSLALGPGAMATSSPASALLPARENPHRLFIREPPPSTGASPARGSLTPSTPVGAGAAAATPATPATGPASGAANRPTTAERHSKSPEAAGDGVYASHGSPINGHPPSDLLPKLGSLATQGYSMEPSLRQLQALEASDPAALCAVEGFTLTRRGVGTLRWLVPVDVRGLELDQIARIDQGEVAVYIDSKRKPPVGSELNTACEVTLLGVHRRKGGVVVTDPASVAAWEKRLRRYCAEAGAEFVAYKPDGGVWRFRVEHFSRYGVPADDEDDEGDGADQDGAGADMPSKGTPLGAASLGGDSDLEDAAPGAVERDGGDASMAEEGEPSVGRDYSAAVGYTGTASRGRRAAPRARPSDGADESMDTAGPLQHSLPALLELPPGQLAAMRDSFFRQGRAAAADTASAEAVTAVVLPEDDLMGGALGNRDAALQQRRAAAQFSGAVPSTAHNWARPRPALLHCGASSSEQHAPATALVAGPSSPSRLKALAARSTQLVPAAADAAATGSVCDAFMLMGRSFRAGFGPGGQLAVPVNATVVVGAPAPSISLLRLSPLAGVQPQAHQPAAVDSRHALGTAQVGPIGSTAALRRCSLAALEAHLAMGSRGDGDAAPDAPAWRLVCSRRQLPRLVERQVAAIGRRGDGGNAASNMAELWHLVQVLFAHIEGEDGDEEDGDDGSCADAASMRGDGQDASVLGADSGKAQLAALKRRAALSHWLAAKASRSVREAVAALTAAGGRDALPWALLHLVAGHQLGPATALAAAAGDARLAALLATAGRHAASSADLAKQLSVWHTAGLWRDHFTQPRKLLMAVLSGRMDEASAALQLDWPRALGLALWYSTPPTEGLPAALSVYDAAMSGATRVQGVPPPVPPHADDPSAVLSAAAAEGGAAGATTTDAAYELLAMAARGLRGGGPGATARLLRAAGRGTNPLDAVPGWVLATTLQALGELPDGDSDELDSVMLRLTLDTVQQLLLMATGREAAHAACWAVYVALHLPSPLAAARNSAVRSLLELTAPHWGPVPEAHSLLTDAFGVPAAWLSSAQAVWSGHVGDSAAQLDHLLAAEDAEGAHAVFASHVAPGLFLRATNSSIARLVQLTDCLAASTAAVGPAWPNGGGLYHAWARLFVRPGTAGPGSWRRDIVAEALDGADGVDAAAVAQEAALLAKQLAAAGRSAKAGPAAASRSAVLSRMSADVWQVLSRLGSSLVPGATAMAAVLQNSCVPTGPHQPLVLAGLAAGLAVL